MVNSIYSARCMCVKMCVSVNMRLSVLLCVLVVICVCTCMCMCVCAVALQALYADRCCCNSVAMNEGHNPDMYYHIHMAHKIDCFGLCVYGCACGLLPS